MNESKLVELVDKIEANTTNNNLNWQKTADENVFQTALSSHIIRIEEHQTEEDFPDYIISIVDKNGSVIETLSDGEVQNILKKLSVNGSAFQKMERIFKYAKRQAFGVDQAIDNVIKELNDLPPF